MTDQRSSGDILADRRYRYAEACLAEGDPLGCADVAEQAVALAPGYAPAWLLLGRAREALFRRTGEPAQREAALAALATAHAIDPNDALGVRAHLAGLGAGAGLPALSPAYVRALFDGYAPRFERHLVRGLRYTGPALLRDALPPGVRFARALDLGCGTGLAGAALRDRVGRLTGVDLSPAMLALARAKRCYDRLVEADLGPFLDGEPPASVDLCLAADVFIYLADLAPALAGIARVLRPGGLGAFTLQSPPAQARGTPGASVVLGADGRYAHADAHVSAAAWGAGLDIRVLRPAAARRERGRPVPGRVVVLGRG